MASKTKRRDDEEEDMNFWERFIQPVVAEFTGTFMLTYVTCMCTISHNILAIAVAQGLAVAALCGGFINISGGHFNPATTLAVLLSGGIKLFKALFMILAQFVAALLGASFVRASVLGASYEEIYGGAAVFRGNRLINAFNEYELINTWETTEVLCLIIEVAAGLVIFIAYLQAVVDDRPDHEDPLVYGFAVTVAVIATYTTSGGSFNPAVSIGTAIVATQFQLLYAYVVGPFIAALLAAAFFRTMLGDENKRLFF